MLKFLGKAQEGKEIKGTREGKEEKAHEGAGKKRKEEIKELNFSRSRLAVDLI